MTEEEGEGVALSFKNTPFTEEGDFWFTEEDANGDGWSTEEEYANGDGWFTENEEGGDCWFTEDEELSLPKEILPSEGEGL